MSERLLRATIQFGDLLGGQFIVEVPKLFADAFHHLSPLGGGQPANLLENLGRAHAGNLRAAPAPASRDAPLAVPGRRLFPPFGHPMIPREILKKIRLIELRTTRLVSETLAGQYHSVFKGQGMNFEEVREYQPGDDVRAIDWNVTARMNHPYIKKFVEERELTVMLVVDLSGSGLFGSVEQSKRELAAEIASVLAFSATRNNDKVGLILFTDRVEKYIPPRKGRRHVLRVIRDILFYEPRHPGTNLNTALDFLGRVVPHRAIVVVISDFLGQSAPTRREIAAHLRRQVILSDTLSQASLTALRQANRRHDVVAVQITDRFELELPDLGFLVLQDAETGEVLEVNTGDARRRRVFAERQLERQRDLRRLFDAAGIDSIQLRTDQPYTAELSRFFETREKRRRHG